MLDPQRVEVRIFLRKEQGVLIEQLRRLSAEIADMYYGGLCSFGDEKNPFRLPLAAQSSRKMPEHISEAKPAWEKRDQCRPLLNE